MFYWFITWLLYAYSKAALHFNTQEHKSALNYLRVIFFRRQSHNYTFFFASDLPFQTFDAEHKVVPP